MKDFKFQGRITVTIPVIGNGDSNELQFVFPLGQYPSQAEVEHLIFETDIKLANREIPEYEGYRVLSLSEFQKSCELQEKISNPDNHITVVSSEGDPQ